MPRQDSVLPPRFWSQPTLANALARCDFSVILDSVRSAHGWSQGELAHAVGYSQSWVSRVINGRQSLTLEQVREIADRLAIPLRLLRFTDADPAAAAREDEGASPTRRRDFGKALAVAALPMTTYGDGEAGAATAATLRAITAHQRALDASVPARDLARTARAQLELSNRSLARERRTPPAASLAAAASEAAGFAAWLHMDMGDAGSARAHYRTAIAHARRAGHGLLAAYMLGSLAAFETEADDPKLGLALAAEAERRLDTAVHPTTRAWLSCTRALAYAGCGDGASARRELVTAERAAERGDNDAPPWPWLFAFDGGKVTGYRALAAVRLRRPHEARAAFAETSGRAHPSAKQGAILLVEQARAHVDAGEIDHAFALAGEALRIGVEYRSERVIGRVRRFRRDYRGPGGACVHALDERLAALLATGTVG